MEPNWCSTSTGTRSILSRTRILRRRTSFTAEFVLSSRFLFAVVDPFPVVVVVVRPRELLVLLVLELLGMVVTKEEIVWK